MDVGVSMITLNDIGAAIVIKLRDSAAILAQSETYFTLPHAIYYGAGGPQSPVIEGSPEFMIIPMSMENPEAGDKEYEFLLGCTFKDETDTAATSGAGVCTEVFGGYEKIEVLLDLAWTEIKAISPSLLWNKGSMEMSPLELFPNFTARMTIRATLDGEDGWFRDREDRHNDRKID